MPNSLNYGTPLTSTLFQRPSRLTPADLRVLRMTNSTVIFGTTANDLVELWIYNPDGSIFAHVNLGPTDEVLRQATFVDQTGANETVEINLRALADNLFLDPGRYAMVGNFFRNEVGSETTNQLYIANISDDRTELRLEPIETTPEVLAQIYEFVTPSVPKQQAKGLIDEVFGASLDVGPDEKVTSSKVEEKLDVVYSDTMHRVGYALANQEYLNLYGLILTRTYRQAIENMAADVFNYRVQQIELESYIAKALHDVIYSIVQMKEYDARFELI